MFQDCSINEAGRPGLEAQAEVRLVTGRGLFGVVEDDHIGNAPTAE